VGHGKNGRQNKNKKQQKIKGPLEAKKKKMSEAMDVSEDTGSSSSRVVVGGGPSIRVVLPGDDLTTYLTELHERSGAGSSQPLKVSHGISSIVSSSLSSSSSSAASSENSEQIHQLIATLPGQLMMSQGNKNRNNPSVGNHYVECSRRRYYPRQGDQVVGIIEERGGDFYTVNIFSGRHCLLNRLAFEGATKRNRPELKRGDLVYARVILADVQRDTELSCVNTNGVKKDWSSGETIYGPLPQGLLINVATGFAKRLLRPDCVVLNCLSK
jgi:hypothetical protein